MDNMEYKRSFNVFVGGKMGAFKGINANTQKVIVKNIMKLSNMSKEQEITVMAWGDPDEQDVLIGLVNQKVKIYDSNIQEYTSSVDVNCGSGEVRGLARYNGSLVTGVESGHVKVWKVNSTDVDVIETGDRMSKMAHSPVNCDIIATGGNANDLKLWNLRSKECTFKAKNVHRDFLDLDVPIWVNDIVFQPNSSQVAICSRYGHVRLYDPTREQRRPVVDVHIKDEVLTTLDFASRENHVVVGSGTGSLMLVDLRSPGKFVTSYKGFVGGIRSVACHKTKPYIVSVGLDRHLRVHNLDTKAQICKEYIKARLNCVLIRDSFSLDPTQCDTTSRKYTDVVNLDDEEEYDELYNDMPKSEV